MDRLLSEGCGCCSSRWRGEDLLQDPSTNLYPSTCRSVLTISKPSSSPCPPSSRIGKSSPRPSAQRASSPLAPTSKPKLLNFGKEDKASMSLSVSGMHFGDDQRVVRKGAPLASFLDASARSDSAVAGMGRCGCWSRSGRGES